MLNKKEMELIFSTPELWRGFHILEELYNKRRDSMEDSQTYKLAFRAFRAQVEGKKGNNVSFDILNK